jgi:PEP-CTERM motif-containing protein
MLKGLILSGAVTLSVLAAMPANAALITSQGALSSNDSIDWGQLGAAFTVLTSPQSVTSTGGAAATVSSAGGGFERRDQGNGWSGNFTAGDHLLWTQEDAGPDITIDFANPVRGAGAQIMADFFGDFVARITLSNGHTFTENGTSNTNNDGSAIFIGALDATADISSIAFTLDSAASNPNDLAIDTLYLNTTAGVASVPEPSTLLLLFSGLAGLGAARRRKARKA